MAYMVFCCGGGPLLLHGFRGHRCYGGLHWQLGFQAGPLYAYRPAERVDVFGCRGNRRYIGPKGGPAVSALCCSFAILLSGS